MAASIEHDKGSEDVSGRNQVGLILSDNRTSASGYSKSQIEMLEEQLKQKSVSPVRLDWRGPVDGAFLRQLEGLDWAIVDIGPDACATGLPAFLHGRFLPQMRLLRASGSEGVDRSPLETTLLASFEVGYPKDIVRWRTAKSLNEQVRQRLSILYDESQKPIADNNEARTYFASAALRQVTVFVSYSKADRDFAARLVEILKKHFQTVFDYRDPGESIPPGRNWLEEVFDTLSQTAIGIPLISNSFLRSNNCTHEAQQMVALKNSGTLQIIPIKLKDEDLKIPPWLQSTQYLRGWEYRTAREVVTKIIADYDSNSPSAK